MNAEAQNKTPLQTPGEQPASESAPIQSPEPQNEGPQKHGETLENAEIREKAEEQTRQQMSGQGSDQKQATATEPTSDAPQQEDQQVQTLTQLALHKGLNKAIQEARKTKNAYILDKVHDELVAHLKDELIQEGKLKELK